jgi:hypothetical protein
MPLKTFIYPQGSVVRVRQGRFPMDPTIVGRTGLVVSVDDYRPEHYGVRLDDETALRDLLEDELELVESGSGPREGETGGSKSGTATLRSPG